MWILEEADIREAEAALDYVSACGAYAPGNFRSEVVHPLLGAQRRNRIDSTHASAALTEILALGISIESPDPHAIMSIAREHRLTGYDAAYLALAAETQFRLATVDAELRKATLRANLLWSADSSA